MIPSARTDTEKGTTSPLIEHIEAPPLALSLHWNDGLISAIDIMWSASVKESPTLSREGSLLKEALLRYVAGEVPLWPHLPLDFSALTPFQRAVLDALALVRHGTLTTYGELAATVGSPGGAQAVGGVMGRNPFPLLYPCHRVVGSNGALTGFSATGGLEMKAFLLKHEGGAELLKKKEPPIRQPSLFDYITKT